MGSVARTTVHPTPAVHPTLAADSADLAAADSMAVDLAAVAVFTAVVAADAAKANYSQALI
jgi:hypothetical protein